MDAQQIQIFSVVQSPVSENPAKTMANRDNGVSPAKIMKIRKYQLHPKTYSTKWEEDPNYKGWVQRSKKGDGYYYCLACNQDYTCGKSELDKHASSKKHCMNMMSLPKITNGSGNEVLNNQEIVFKTSCDTFESITAGRIIPVEEFEEVYSIESKEEAFGKYVISELKRIKKRKNYESVKWEILQSLRNAILKETENGESED